MTDFVEQNVTEIVFSVAMRLICFDSKQCHVCYFTKGFYNHAQVRIEQVRVRIWDP